MSACSSKNPLCAKILELMPGNSVGLRFDIAISTSVKSAKLAEQNLGKFGIEMVDVHILTTELGRCLHELPQPHSGPASTQHNLQSYVSPTERDVSIIQTHKAALRLHPHR